jgi:hypothetical protein
MGLRIFVGHEAGYDSGDDQAILHCSTTEIAFGRIFYPLAGMDAVEVAQAFLNWCEKDRKVNRGDVRLLSTAETIHLQDEFLQLPAAEIEQWKEAA